MLAQTLKFKPWRFSRFRSPSNSGERIKKVFSGKYDKEGRLVVDEVGSEDVYDYIQSFADSVDINTILARFENGDVDVLNKVQGFYFDTTSLPENMADLLNKLNFAESEFEKMPPSFKEKYGNDFARFLCSFDPRDFVSDLVEPDSPVIEKEEGVVSDES